MGLYPLGTEVTMFTTFTLEGDPTDPSDVTATVELPDETTAAFVFGTDAELTNPSVGYYELAYLPPDPGVYNYLFEGEGAVVATSPTGSFTVLASGIGSQQDQPCEPWISGDDVALCCNQEESTSPEPFEQAAFAAQELLYELSGRRYLGTCSRTVRPCRTDYDCGMQVLSRGHIVWSGHEWAHNGMPCGCTALSEVKLAGTPVRAISQVKIDGAIVPASEYRLDKRAYLVRLNGERWPACQRLDLPDSEEGTWSVSYVYGKEPPEAGRMAAAQLACEVYKSCAGLECALPSGATRVTRQGITIERTFMQRDPNSGAWRSGLSLVDAFLNTYNPSGLKRKPTIWAPGKPYPRQVGA